MLLKTIKNDTFDNETVSEPLNKDKVVDIVPDNSRTVPFKKSDKIEKEKLPRDKMVLGLILS